MRSSRRAIRWRCGSDGVSPAGSGKRRRFRRWRTPSASIPTRSPRRSRASIVSSRNGKDEDFGRGETAWEKLTAPPAQGGNPYLGAIEQPPFYAAPCHRVILGTKGGPRTNARGQALRADGSVIAGLYCAGLAMANPIGTKAVGAGTTLGPCLTWGYICGLALAGGEGQIHA